MIRRTTAATAGLALGASVPLPLTACGGTDTGASADVPADCKPAHTFPTVKPNALTVGVISSLPYSSLNPV